MQRSTEPAPALRREGRVFGSLRRRGAHLVRSQIATIASVKSVSTQQSSASESSGQLASVAMASALTPTPSSEGSPASEAQLSPTWRTFRHLMIADARRVSRCTRYARACGRTAAYFWPT